VEKVIFPRKQVQNMTIFYWPPIPIFQNLLNDIFADNAAKVF